MARTQVAEFAIEPEADSFDEAFPQPTEPTVVSPTSKRAKVKGTWTMFYGSDRYDFVDGHIYHLPLDLYAYLKSSGNIYDTAF
jgi:hypothetical protein